MCKLRRKWYCSKSLFHNPPHNEINQLPPTPTPNNSATVRRISPKIEPIVAGGPPLDHSHRRRRSPSTATVVLRRHPTAADKSVKTINDWTMDAHAYNSATDWPIQSQFGTSIGKRLSPNDPPNRRRVSSTSTVAARRANQTI
jgi:hypothetical protein